MYRDRSLRLESTRKHGEFPIILSYIPLVSARNQAMLVPLIALPLMSNGLIYFDHVEFLIGVYSLSIIPLLACVFGDYIGKVKITLVAFPPSHVVRPSNPKPLLTDPLFPLHLPQCVLNSSNPVSVTSLPSFAFLVSGVWRYAGG